MSYQPKIYRKQGGEEMVVASGATLNLESGALLRVPFQSLTAATKATEVAQSGVTMLQGTTTGPGYTLAAPTAAGVWKEIILNATSSGATHRCTVFSGSTGLPFSHPTGGSGNTITLNTSAQAAVRLVSLGTTAWQVLHAYAVKDPALSNKST